MNWLSIAWAAISNFSVWGTVAQAILKLYPILKMILKFQRLREIEKEYEKYKTDGKEIAARFKKAKTTTERKEIMRDFNRHVRSFGMSDDSDKKGS